MDGQGEPSRGCGAARPGATRRRDGSRAVRPVGIGNGSTRPESPRVKLCPDCWFFAAGKPDSARRRPARVGLTTESHGARGEMALYAR